jgi:DNA-binding XRE family transcriptional regulator
LFCQENILFLHKKGHIMHFKQLVDKIKERRDELQVTQETLAEISDVGLRTLKQFESGKGNPTLLTVTKLVESLGMELSLQVKKTKSVK